MSEGDEKGDGEAFVDLDGAGLRAWEQQPGEPPEYYEVFNIFCLMGPTRSVRAAAEKWHKQIKKPPKPGAFLGIATAWQWQRRATAYWIEERRRNEWLLQERRDATYLRYAEFFDRMFEKLMAGLDDVQPDATTKNLTEAALKSFEGHRNAFGDTDEERKRRGRPREEDGELPSVDDVLKPPEEE